MGIERRKQILAILSETGSDTISNLAARTGVSAVTIRKDIQAMQEEGLAIHEHGMALLKKELNYYPLDLREKINPDSKKAIAAKALSLLKPNDTIILDSGSTTLEIAKLIMNYPPMSIITNSIAAAEVLSESEHIITVIGGQVFNHSYSIVNSNVAQIFSDIHTDILFLATTGISNNLELSTGYYLESASKKAMIEAADKVVLLADSSKFCSKSTFVFCKPDKIDCIITDKKPSDDIMKVIDDYSIELIVASKS